MRTARLSALTALVLSVTGALPLAVSAQAATADLYVDKGNASCSDTSATAGGQATPFCTISGAAALVQPGETVHIAQGVYGEDVHLTRSGTPGAPITFLGYRPAGQTASQTQVNGTTHAFLLDGVHDVVVDSLWVNGGQEAVLVTSSSQVTLNHLYVTNAGWAGAANYPSIRIGGQSSGVTLSRNVIGSGHGDGIVIDPGVSHAVVTTNQLYNNHGRGIAVTDAPGTAVTSNQVIRGCGPEIELAGNSGGASVENNALEAVDNSGAPWGGCANTARLDLAVSAGSTSGTTADYNAVATNAQTPYSWAGQTYPDVASFQKATGQGAHDLSAAFGTAFNALLVDSADANAPGELATDIVDATRIDDPNVPNTGTGVGYYDRGVRELQDQMYVSVIAQQSTVPGHPLDATITGGMYQPWGAVSVSVDFGDGSAPVSSPTFPLAHTYPGPGTYTVTLTGTDSVVGSKKTTYFVTIAPVGPIQPDLAVSTVHAMPGQPDLPLRVDATTNGTGSPWPITKNTLDFGDGTVVDTVLSPGGNTHDYKAPGTYSVTETITDDHGRTGAVTKTVTVGSDYQPLATPTRILDTRTGLGAATQPVGPGGVVKLQVTGRAGVPADGKVTAVLLNLTATDSTDSTFVTAFPGGAVPTASSLNVTPGHDVGNAVLVPVAADGTVSLYNHTGNVDLVADVQGYYTTQPQGPSLRLGTLTQAVRTLDTRDGTGGVNGPVGPGGTIKFQVRGPGQLPADAQAVVLNLTATDGTDATYVTAAPNGTPPTNSSLNVGPGQTVANQVTVPINPDGTVTLYNHTGNVSLIADLQGYYSPTTGASVLTVTPTRLVDTRVTRQTLGAGSVQMVKVRGTAGVPDNVKAVLVNLTATGPTDNTWLKVYQPGSPWSSTSNLNVTPGATVPNLALVPVDSDGNIAVYNHTGSTDVIVDLQGYTVG